MRGIRPRAGALIFDDLTFTLATGDAEFRRSAIETIEGIRAIKRELPGVLTSLGVSNVRSVWPHARAVLNSVFLHHCVEAGLDMAIVNPAHITPYAEIDAEQRVLADDLIFDRREDALARFIAYFEDHGVEAEGGESIRPPTWSRSRRIHWKILHLQEGRHRGADRRAPVESGGGDHDAAVWMLNNVLLPAMKEVGDKFGAGELILPFVLQSAEVMKAAVATLETYLEKSRDRPRARSCWPPCSAMCTTSARAWSTRFCRTTATRCTTWASRCRSTRSSKRRWRSSADAIGLSALLVSTSKQMPLCVQELHSRGLTYPVLVGGAAINPSFVRTAAVRQDRRAVRSGRVLLQGRVRGPLAVEALVDPRRRTEFVSDRLEEIREGLERRAALKATVADRARDGDGRGPRTDVPVPEPAFYGTRE